MKYPLFLRSCLFFTIIMTVILSSDSLFSHLCFAKDMRNAHIDLEAKKAQLKAKAQKELEAARAEALRQEQIIRNDRVALVAAVEKLKRKNADLTSDNNELESKVESLKEQEKSLSESLEKSSAINKELAGVLRGNSKDLETLLIQSLQSALVSKSSVQGMHSSGGQEAQGNPYMEKSSGSQVDSVPAGRHAFLRPMIDQKRFPSMEDIRKMVSTLFEEIKSSGEVKLTRGVIVDRHGIDRDARLLILGNFTAVYSLKSANKILDSKQQGSSTKISEIADAKESDGETGFLLYSEQSQRFFALSALPDSHIIDNLEEYMAGKRDDVYMDISKGAALRQLTHKLNLWEQIPKGGPIVWPIIGIFAVALLILLERVLFFLKKSMNPEFFMKRLEVLVYQNRWDECIAFISKNRSKLIPKILLTAIEFRDQSRTDMENALQEAILNEIPRIERFLSTLGMLAAIAPLMGLLGTVTGMINVFHTITCYGTGDPRMMSGGISEALVTTMLGLSVAIPVMLVHTLLSRKVETEIGKMEEKAVSFVNMVFKNRNGK